MNHLTKMVLITLDEYSLLKSLRRDDLSKALDQSLHNHSKQDLINKVIDNRIRKQKKNRSIDPQLNQSSVSNKEDKTEGGLSINSQTMKEESTKFTPTFSSTPMSSSDLSSTPMPSSEFSSIINSKGEIENSAGEVIPASNIKDIKTYMQTPRIKKARKPLGYNVVLKYLQSKPEKVQKIDIKNEEVQEDLKKLQGGGRLKLWSSLKKF